MMIRRRGKYNEKRSQVAILIASFGWPVKERKIAYLVTIISSIFSVYAVIKASQVNLIHI